jgi:Uma2 family endonuclease
MMSLWETALAADRELGIRLEMVNGVPVWEMSPAFRHQRVIDRIRDTIQRKADSTTLCECLHVADVYIRFPDGSLKRPDISLFCREPDEQTTAVTLKPEAVIEIISPDYAAKDLEIGVPFYLAQEVRDVVVFDPDTNQVTHYRDGIASQHTSPVALEFACGCVAMV